MSSLPPLCPKSRWRTEYSQLSTDAGCHLLHVYICSKKLSPYNVRGCILKPCWRHQGDSYEFAKIANCLFLNRKQAWHADTGVSVSLHLPHSSHHILPSQALQKCNCAIFQTWWHVSKTCLLLHSM